MTVRTVALAALSGILIAASFPTIDLHSLAWIALIPLLLSLTSRSVWNGFLLGGVTGIVYFIATVHWVTNSVHFYGGIALVPASLITLLLCAYLALYPALFGALAVRLRRLHPSLFFLSAPALWTALELARTYVFTGFPWSLLGYTQYRALPVIQIADMTGVYGVSFLIVFVNTTLAEFLQERRRYYALVVAVLLMAGVLSYGAGKLRSPEGEGSVTISVIQGNIEQDRKWDPAYQAEVVATYKRLTSEALKQKPDLVIWPETATPFYFGGDGADAKRTEDLKKYVKAAGVPLLTGSPTYEVLPGRVVHLRNSAFLLDRDGAVTGMYDKVHLVPFGEYVPLKDVLFFVGKMVEAIGDFQAGTEYTVMEVRAPGGAEARVSTVICYEIIFPDLVRRFVGRGANVLTTITNDAWFGRTAAPYQHFSMAVFRAVENRVPVARAANTGISGFIDPKGRILDASPVFTEARLTHTLAPGTVRTFYAKYGDIFAYACVLVSLILLASIPKKVETYH